MLHEFIAENREEIMVVPGIRATSRGQDRVGSGPRVQPLGN